MAPWSSWLPNSSKQPQEQQQPQQSQQSQTAEPRQSLAPGTGDLPPKPSPHASLIEPAKIKKHNDDGREMPSPAELRQIAAKSLQTGALTGGMGLLVGAGSGILRSAPPTLFALFAGFQWFTLGSSYMAAKGLLHHAWGGEENMTSSDFVKASGVAGGVSGMVGGMIRGPKNILPGVLFFGALGAGSSYVSQLSQSSPAKEKTSWLDSKWSPMQRLSDKEYMDKLEEKILRLDAEIAIIDENIASLKASPQQSTTSLDSSAKN
ncbi:hypothetical protein GGS20DRAFT_526954 [Poronia punctata]|nr:hypothetical protein GGS20DRAFT_526954 [Poronia punctata]